MLGWSAWLGKPRAPTKNPQADSGTYVALAFFFTSAHLALANWESLRFVAALIGRRLLTSLAFLRSAHIFLAASEIRLRPAALIRRPERDGFAAA
jgi:hypothetical protein